MAQNNNNQNGNGKNPSIATAPQGNQSWKIEYPLKDGGTLTFNGETNIDILAAHKGIRAVIEATCCSLCQSHNTRLTHRNMTGQNGDYTQYVMVCDDCGAGYSFSTHFSHDALLTPNFKEQYRGWIKYEKTDGNGDGNTNGNRQPDRSQTRQPAQPQSRPQGRQEQPRQQPVQQTDEYDGWEDSNGNDLVPF